MSVIARDLTDTRPAEPQTKRSQWASNQTLATSLATLHKKTAPRAAILALHLKYRYGDSNPGFRTENPAS
jgi:hypothetical protein